MLASWRPLLIAAFMLAPAPAAAQFVQHAALVPDELRELESLLRDLGFDPGSVDGVVDDATTAAIGRYQDFALLSGPPEPDRRLLDELRGVAAAFAALSAGKEKVPPIPAALPEKEIVPPPPPPPKLTAPPEAPPVPKAPPVSETIEEEEAQTAALPPPTDLPDSATLPETSPPEAEAPDPEADRTARIDAELLSLLHRLNDGRLTREALPRPKAPPSSETRKTEEAHPAALPPPTALP